MALLAALAARAVAVKGDPDRHSGRGRGLRGDVIKAGAWGWEGGGGAGGGAPMFALA